MKCPSSHALHVYRDGLQRSVSFHGGILKMRGCLLYILYIHHLKKDVLGVAALYQSAKTIDVDITPKV